MVTLAPGPTSILKAGGTSLMIHADPDDYVTDPAGNSGARIACGTIVAGAAALPATGGGPGSVRELASPVAVVAAAVGLLALPIVRALREPAAGDKGSAAEP
jgi:hypothetical protein